MSPRVTRTGIGGALLALLLASSPAAAGPLEDCAAIDPSFKLAYDAFVDGNARRALAAWVEIDLDALSPVCRVEARELRALCLIAEDRRNEVPSLYLENIEERPDWRPNPRSPGQPIFDRVYREWFQTHAGPPQVTQLPLGFRSEVGEAPRGVRELVIRSQVGGELTWEAEALDAWVQLSKTSGTTVGEKDTIFVTIGPIEGVDEAGRSTSQILVRSAPWPDQRVGVQVEWTEKPGGLLGVRNLAIAGLLGGGVAALLLAGGGDEDNPPPPPLSPLPEPPAPPGGGSR